MPITPVFDEPPVAAIARYGRGIDWTETVAALKERPGEWARVDGPYPGDKSGASKTNNHGKSLRSFADKLDVEVETKRGTVDSENWLWARAAATPDADQADEPEPAPAAAKAKDTRPLVAVDDTDDEDLGYSLRSDGSFECMECGPSVVRKTEAAIRSHMATTHKRRAS